jgi:O-methyltransferase
MRLKNFLRSIKKKIIRNSLKDLYKRIEDIEYREYNRRFYAVTQAAEYLTGALIEGDYCEFGVFKGTTFSYVYRWLSPFCPKLRYIAFDSFEGLPEIKGIDYQNGYSSNFSQGEFSCTEEEFLNSIRKQNVDLNQVVTIKGWFCDTLNSSTAQKIDLKRIAFAWIDCDVYESTVPVLDFITPYLDNGSLIIFDDWTSFKNLPYFGEQRACNEWLSRNPRIKLNHLFSYGSGGIAFTIQIVN